jgi:hypothetical protein
MAIKETTGRIQSWGRNRSFIGLTLWLEVMRVEFLTPIQAEVHRCADIASDKDLCYYKMSDRVSRGCSNYLQLSFMNVTEGRA